MANFSFLKELHNHSIGIQRHFGNKFNAVPGLAWSYFFKPSVLSQYRWKKLGNLRNKSQIRYLSLNSQWNLLSNKCKHHESFEFFSWSYNFFWTYFKPYHEHFTWTNLEFNEYALNYRYDSFDKFVFSNEHCKVFCCFDDYR